MHIARLTAASTKYRIQENMTLIRLIWFVVVKIETIHVFITYVYLPLLLYLINSFNQTPLTS